jgi:LysM repeat protein
MAGTIGIKIANGEFYSIIDENSNVKKRLILTTVHDNQRSVQIDLYKSSTMTMADALYIGSLVVEDIKRKPKGDPSIEMIISSNAKGFITAKALDLDTRFAGRHQYLNVSLQSLDEDDRDMYLSDFELEQEGSSSSGLYRLADKIMKWGKAKQGKELWALGILLGMLVLFVFLVLFFFISRDKNMLGRGGIRSREILFAAQNSAQPSVKTDAPAVPAARPATESAAPEDPADSDPAAQAAAESAAPEDPVDSDPAAQAAAEAAVPEDSVDSDPLPESQSPAPQAEAAPQPPPVIEAPAQSSPPAVVSRRRNPPVASYKVPASIPQGGAVYRVRWGDTLWDISEAFYRNPWLYPRIARYNGIRNSDLIVAGTTIRIPPRN